MAVVKVPASDFLVEVENPTTPGSFVEIKGLNSLEFSPSAETADTTTWDDGGWNTHLVTRRGLQITLEGLRLEDPATGARDQGQQIVEELGMQVGLAAIGKFRLTSPGGEKWEFDATVNVTPLGGGQDDGATWSAELTVQGQPVLIRAGGSA